MEKYDGPPKIIQRMIEQFNARDALSSKVDVDQSMTWIFAGVPIQWKDENGNPRRMSTNIEDRRPVQNSGLTDVNSEDFLKDSFKAARTMSYSGMPKPWQVFTK